MNNLSCFIPSNNHQLFPAILPKIKRLSPQWLNFGGAERDRTDDLLLARQALSQLSYSPMFGRMLFQN
jgi:hypothetical protein